MTSGEFFLLSDAAARRGLTPVGDYLRQQAVLMSRTGEIGYDYALERLCDAWYPDFKEPREVIRGNMDILDKLPIPEDKKAELRTAARELARTSPQSYQEALERIALTWYMSNAKPVGQIKTGFRHTKTVPSRMWKSGRRR